MKQHSFDILFLRKSSQSVLYFTLMDCLCPPRLIVSDCWPYGVTYILGSYYPGQHSSRSPGLYSAAASSGVQKGMTYPLLRPILLLTDFALSLNGATTHSAAQVRNLLLIFPACLFLPSPLNFVSFDS